MTPKSFEIPRKAKEVLAILKEEAKTVTTWADFSNRMSGPRGVIAEYFPELVEKQAFCDTPEYEELSGMRLALMKKFGILEGANPKMPTDGSGQWGL